MGIFDLVQALQWINENIENFGGDKNNVTIFGESGGGAKVLALMETPYAKKLFKRGIVESGATETMGVLWTPKEASERVTELTLENLGLKKGEFEKLQSVPYSALVEASDKALLQAGEEFKIPAALGTGYLIFWEPYVDGDFIPDDIAGKNGFPKNDEKADEILSAFKSAYPEKHDFEAAYVDSRVIRIPMLNIQPRQKTDSPFGSRIQLGIERDVNA